MGRVSPGTLLQGTYCIGRLLGTGGMGEVYEATHRRLSGRYAIKLLLRELALRPDAFARFRREAEITSALHHPNIVQVIDFNLMDDESPYLVMEFLDGVDLSTRLEQGPLPLSAALPLVKQIASALAAAHGRGIVHRDLKPQNIFLVRVEGEDREEIPKILDFGISKMKSASKSVTIDTVVLGTPQYMSPEQALGKTEEIDHATDQFALGAITYEMLTGRQAFVGEDPLAVMYQVVHGTPAPLMTANAGRGVAAVEAVLFKAMAKKKTDRYATIHEFARALAAVASDGTEIVTGQHERLTPAPTMAFGHWTAAPQVDSPGTEPAPATREAVEPPAQLVPRTPTTFRTAVGEMLPRPRRTGKLLAVAGSVVAAATLIGLLAFSGRPVSVKASLPAPTTRAAAQPRPVSPPEAVVPLPAVELVAPIEPMAEPGPALEEEPPRFAPRRRQAGPSSAQRRAMAAIAAPPGPAPAAPAAAVPPPQPAPPPPPPPKPSSDLVKGDDL
jgi:eukaryotic-like serine/threonine-protein kinase